MNTNQFAALLGFAFVAAWIGFGLLDAILCLVGAAVLYLAVAVRQGEIDLAELQDRVGSRRAPGGSSSPTGPGAPAPRRRVE
ncbi:MAG: hypothetical protein ACR2LV_02195 [Solirubrobacteraceae bacterium]